MKAIISWWDLAGSDQTIDSLRTSLLNDGVEAWSKVPGLRLKFWISDRQTDRGGAVMLWEDSADPTVMMPANRATELIGYPPSLRLTTDVEAVVEGLNVKAAEW